MGQLFTVGQVSLLTGVTPQTVRDWEGNGYIPRASRIGLRKKRAWNELQLALILDFAKSNGYATHARCH